MLGIATPSRMEMQSSETPGKHATEVEVFRELRGHSRVLAARIIQKLSEKSQQKAEAGEAAGLRWQEAV